jgi:hypothetical protein
MSVTLEELVVKLEAQNQQFMQAMVASQGATQRAMSGIQAAVAGMAEDGSKNLGFFEQSMATMAGFVGGEIVIGAFNMAKDAAKALFQSLVVDGVAASSEAIDAMNRLNFSLAQNGKFTNDVSAELANWAGELQKTTKYEDDAIIKSAAYIETLGKLDKDGLQRATEAALNLSAALGIDLDQATKMVGKAAAGEVAAFSKLGIQIQESADKSKTFENALRAIADLGPAATNAAQSYSGAQARIAHSYGEVQEQVGGLITKNVAVVDTMNAVADVFFGASDSIDDNQQALRELVAGGLVLAIDACVGLITVLDALGRVGSAVFNTIQGGAYSALLPIVKAMNLVGLASDEMVETIKIGMMESGKAAITSFSEDTALGEIGVKFAEVGLKAEEGLEKVRAGMVAIPEVTNNTKKKIDELTVSMATLVSEGEKLANSYLEASLSGQAMADDQLAKAELVRNAKMMQATEEENSNWFALDSLRNRKDQELEAEMGFIEAKREILAGQQEAEMTAVQASYDAGKTSLEAYEAAKKGIKNKYSLEGQKLDQEEANKKLSFMEKEVQDRKAQIGVLAGLQDSQNAYAKNVGKAFAVANTIIKTQEGAQAAYAAMAGIPFVGPALGYAAAAAVIADGATRLSAIRGAKGGITEVPGIGGRDTFGPVALAPGERVVPGETNQDLKAAIGMIMNGEAGGGGRIVVELHFKGGMENLMDVIETKLVEREREGVSLRVS